MAKLTKRTIEAAPAREKDYIIFDSELPGFGLRVLPSGRRSYLVQYRVGSRTRRVSMGLHGAITPHEARKLALQLLAAVRAGGDPSAERRAERGAMTLEELGVRFLRDYVPQHCKASTAREYRRAFELFINPTLGRLKVHDVDRKDVAQFHHDLRHIPYQANRALGVLSKALNQAELWGLRPDATNPCRHVKKYREERRERFLSPEELQRLGKVLDELDREGLESPYVTAAIRLLLFTGCRLSEILTLHWEHVDVDGRVIRLPDSKTGAKLVHLGPPALDVLTRLDPKADNSFVIRGKLPGTHLTDLQKPWRRIRSRAGLNDLRLHDLRHSFASRAVALGEGLPMIAKLLGHTQIATTSRYAHLADQPIKAAADRIASDLAKSMGHD
jgi:integrase